MAWTYRKPRPEDASPELRDSKAFAPDSERAARDIASPRRVGDPVMLGKLCMHRTQLDMMRIKIRASDRNFKVTPAILPDFAAILVREGLVYERLEVQVKNLDFGIWQPEVQGSQELDAWIRKRLPEGNQKRSLV